MLDFSHIPTATGNAEVFYFEGSGTAAGQVWIPWQKPRGKSMIDILLVGKGGNGGNGVVGTNTTAAGGGGGGSGAQTRLTMPLALLPDVLYLSLAGVSATGLLASYISIVPKLTAGAGGPAVNDTLMIANGGAVGGNGSGATAGAAGAAGAIATNATMPLGWGFASALIGQAGTAAGGAAGAGTNLVLPTTGLLVTGGTGGGGVGSGNGSNGGQINGAGLFPTLLAGAGSIGPTLPPSEGAHGYRPIRGIMTGYGGTGGGSTSGVATGAGLVGANGGNGAPGCGGGGGGGSLTGSTQGLGGNGGPAFCVITCW